MNRKIIIRPEAAREVQEAFDWYEERDEGLGAEFLRAAEACLSAIRRNPFTNGSLTALDTLAQNLLDDLRGNMKLAQVERQASIFGYSMKTKQKA